MFFVPNLVSVENKNFDMQIQQFKKSNISQLEFWDLYTNCSSIVRKKFLQMHKAIAIYTKEGILQ